MIKLTNASPADGVRNTPVLLDPAKIQMITHDVIEIRDTNFSASPAIALKERSGKVSLPTILKPKEEIHCTRIVIGPNAVVLVKETMDEIERLLKD